MNLRTITLPSLHPPLPLQETITQPATTQPVAQLSAITAQDSVSNSQAHGLLEVPVLVQHVQECGQAYMFTVQWWHEALGHTSPQTWISASERYSDGSLIPKRPPHFFCDACALFNSKQLTLTQLSN